jgi:hypothetical protein
MRLQTSNFKLQGSFKLQVSSVKLIRNSNIQHPTSRKTPSSNLHRSKALWKACDVEVRSSLRDFDYFSVPGPNVETLGYCRISLRENNYLSETVVTVSEGLKALNTRLKRGVNERGC